MKMFENKFICYIHNIYYKTDNINVGEGGVKWKTAYFIINKMQKLSLRFVIYVKYVK